MFSSTCAQGMTEHLLRPPHDGREQVGLVVAVLTLQDGDDTLEPHAGVHVLGRQRVKLRGAERGCIG